jgi:hypothetical protein
MSILIDTNEGENMNYKFLLVLGLMMSGAYSMAGEGEAVFNCSAGSISLVELARAGAAEDSLVRSAPELRATSESLAPTVIDLQRQLRTLQEGIESFVQAKRGGASSINVNMRTALIHLKAADGSLLLACAASGDRK